ncbi:hypothetical protein [Butyrivibrio sp. INlla14]|uniref:hypothetical protein n=1 Tax=Butyrivibrio sp. INlla14 TaxID=1520808 RepID=UPI0008764D3D|nr:hypothetical protein [Butyrivibrio sp. INlla14]SCY62978.1 hypothetical protein SAMN02910371_03105 [Butyrivibrio sp. INlla14]
MRIVITDTGTIWNPDNPNLEKFKDVVLVVCLNGKAVTDKYECFVSPYKQPEDVYDEYALSGAKLNALNSVESKLRDRLGYHEDILFLTDSEPSTLYPFFVIREKSRFYNYHLCTLSPWNFDDKRKRNVHNGLLSNLSALRTIMYINSDDYLKTLDQQTDIDTSNVGVGEYYNRYLPTVINNISDLRYTGGTRYFDFTTNKYILLQDGAKKVDLSKVRELSTQITKPLEKEFCTLGMICYPDYPDEEEDTKRGIEQLVPRIDGKKICNYLRSLRIKLAEENGIPFESEECLSVGPCAGTCSKCDMESKYLLKEIKKIPKAERKVPKELLTEWEVES